MAIPSRSGLTIGGVTLLIWGLAAGSAVYWALRVANGGMAVPAAVSDAAPATPPIDSQAVARLLGATAPVAAVQAPMASRFALKGVVAEPGGGAALIAVDGQPARTFRVGGTVADGLVLQSVTPRQVTLAASMTAPVLATLEVPPLKP